MAKNVFYNDYNRHSFYVKEINRHKKYYIKIDTEYIEVPEEVYKVCKSSYAKMKYAHDKEVEWLNFQEKDLVSLLFCLKLK